MGREPAGYMGISAKLNDWKKVEVAAPDNWSALQSEEQKFLDAEHERLLYVATTRAACAVIVSVGKDNSNWASLHAYLDDAPSLEVPVSVSRPSTSETVPADSVSLERLGDRWSASLEPSYRCDGKGSMSPECLCARQILLYPSD